MALNSKFDIGVPIQVQMGYVYIYTPQEIVCIYKSKENRDYMRISTGFTISCWSLDVIMPNPRRKHVDLNFFNSFPGIFISIQSVKERIKSISYNVLLIVISVVQF